MRSKPDWRRAKEILRAQIDAEPLGGPIDDYTLARALDEAMADDIGVCDGPSTVSPTGRVLMGPSDADWAEVAHWVFTSPSDDQMERWIVDRPPGVEEWFWRK